MLNTNKYENLHSIKVLPFQINNKVHAINMSEPAHAFMLI